MTKKCLALILACSLLLLSACASPSSAPVASGGTAPPAPTADTAAERPAESENPFKDPYELTYYMTAVKSSDQNEVVEAAINQIIGPKFNASIKFIMITSGDWDTKALVPLRAGEKIDIIFTSVSRGFMTQVASDVFMKLNDPDGPYGDLLAQYAPKTVEDLGVFISNNKVDGWNYTVPTQKELCVPGGLIWNEDYVDKYGIDIQTTDSYEEIEPYLAKFKEENPGKYPLLVTAGWSFISPFIQNFLDNMDPISMFIGEEGATDGEPVLIWEQEQTRKHAEQMGKWFKAGYVNPDAQLKSYSTNDEMYAGNFLLTFDQVLKGGQVKAKELMSSSGNLDLRLIEQQTSASIIVTSHLGGSMLAIPVSSKDPVRAMLYIDEMHQNRELINLMAWGVEGLHYDLDDQGRAVQRKLNGWSDSHGGKWTIGNQFMQYVSNQEDLDKYAQMQKLTDEAWNHESLGFRFKQTDYANEYSATYNVTDAMLRGVMSGVNSEGLEAMIQGYKDAGVYDVIYPAVKEAYATWKAGQMANTPRFPATK
jgi:putative aldouronate transport system substrate-binding protein